ncbi:hypothetical protein RIF29_30844 [Crotalaria pallida]|uniref:FBD domain-containing protein n=1 Tax=Crotalaria pallida TaxID=3830 RepID=A0AAN9EGL4_CROPI
MSKDEAVAVGSSAVTENDRSKIHRVDDDDDADMISYLPEGVLGHILSCLLTKEAVRTSVLSKRWVLNWTFINKVDLDDTFLYSEKRSENAHQHFVNLVNKILGLDNSCIKSFALNLSAENTCHLNSWIASMLEKSVENLRIRAAKYIVLSPCSLFDSKSLVELVLDINCTVKVPLINCLPKLQILRLSRITFDCDSSCTQSKELVLSLPVLKVFESRECTWNDVTIQAPLLENFYLECFSYIPYFGTAIWSFDTVKVCASHVAKFSYHGHLTEGIIVLDPPSVLNGSADLFLEVCREEDVQQTASRACMLLKQISEVESLKLACRMWLIYAKYFLANSPVFGRLTYLHVDMVAAEALLDLLNKSPNLKTLVLNHATAPFDYDLFASAMVPHCFLSSLEVVLIREFEPHHLHLAKFVIENAVVLEHMTISTFMMWRRSVAEMQNIKEELFSFPQCSSNALIEFSMNVYDY